ncbi:MAG: tetratricopeptide repeat protein [Planctomycetes bacterium]|nr:tetratricopeptide repeat protein [Planctomycetota bacterium]
MRPRRWLGLILLALGSCGASESRFRPDVPPLDGVEPAVATRVLEVADAFQSADDLKSHALWARVLDANGFGDEAVRAYDALAARDEAPHRFEARYLAACRLESKDPGLALDRLDEAIALRPDYRPARLRRADLAWRLGRLDAAAGDYEWLLQGASDLPAMLGMARIQIDRDQWSLARVSLEAARSIDPGDPRVCALLSRVLAREGEGERARQLAALARAADEPRTFHDPIQVAMLAEGRSSSSCRRFAAVCLRAGRWDEAIEWSNRALRAQPEDLEARLVRGMTRARRGQGAAAIEDLAQVVQARPTDLRALEELASAHALIGERAQAIEVLDRALDLNPDRLHARYLRAVLWRDARPERAEPDLRRVLAAAPDHFDALLSLAQLLVSARRLDEARSVLQRLHRLAPDDARVGEIERRLNP